MAMKICVLGIWHLGTVTSACLADLGFQVVGVDQEPTRVEELNRGRPPLFEPGLEELLARNLTAGRLRYATDVEEGVRGADYVLIAYDTPVDERDEVDLSGLFAAAEAVAPHMSSGATLVVCSQVPAGTCEKLAENVSAVNPSLAFGIACVPENLRLGQAIERFRHPDMIVIGSDDSHTLTKVAELFAPIEAPKVSVSLRTAEMTKHAINAYLATCISFANELAVLCDMVGADALKVAQALRMDARVSAKAPLLPGSGFSGGTLARDVKVLRRLGRQHDYPPPLLDGVWKANQRQAQAPVRKLKEVYPALQDQTVTVLGLTYKPGTSTLRRSAALEVIKTLVSEGARVLAYDPKADPEELAHHQGFTVCPSVEHAARGSGALLLMTPWPEFRELDFAQIGESMMSRVFIDAHNYLDGESLAEQGFKYLGVGRGVRPAEARS
jgi:UDPglucose 6-dehydrogenase